MTTESTTGVQDAISGARASLRRLVAWRAATTWLAASCGVFLAGAVTSRVAPGSGALEAGAVAAAVAASAGFARALALSRGIGHRDAALFLDRALGAKEHFVAALEMSRGGSPGGPEAASITAGSALGILRERRDALPDLRPPLDRLVPPLLLLGAAGAVLLLPEAAAPPRPRDVAAAAGPETPGTRAGRAAAGRAPAGVVSSRHAPAGRTPDGPGVPTEPQGAPGTGERPPRGRGAAAGGAAASSPRDLLARARAAGLSAAERQAILRLLEDPDEAPAPGRGRPGEETPPPPTLPRAPGLAHPLPGGYPRRYRDVVARYFDPAR